MKRILCLVISALLCLTFVACGAKTSGWADEVSLDKPAYKISVKVEQGVITTAQHRVKGENGEELYRFSTENGCVKQDNCSPDFPSQDWVFTLKECVDIVDRLIPWVSENLTDIKVAFYIDNVNPKFAFLEPTGGPVDAVSGRYVYSLFTGEISPLAGEYEGFKEYGSMEIYTDTARNICYIDE